MFPEEDGWPDVLTGWEFAAMPTTEAISYDLEAAPPEEIPVWRVDLPADPQQAAAQFQDSAARLRASQVALESVPGRVDQLVGRLQASLDAGVSFDAVQAEPLPAPEAELLYMLDVIEAGEQGVSFGLGEPAAGELDRAGGQFQAAMERLLRLFSHFAWVETQIDGELLGRTAVGWTGSMNTTWGLRVDETQANLHRHNLETALASRNTSLRTLSISVQSAVKLSVLLATPGGAILALPVAWKFVNQILAQAGK